MSSKKLISKFFILFPGKQGLQECAVHFGCQSFPLQVTFDSQLEITLKEVEGQ